LQILQWYMASSTLKILKMVGKDSLEIEL